MTPPVCFIRADAAPAVGGGHVMRCLTLAAELHGLGWKIVLATTRETPATVAGFMPAWLEVEILTDGADPKALLEARPTGCRLLIVDHYKLDAAYEAACRGWAEKICVIDDLADRRHDCDVLLDQTLGRARADYSALVPRTCTVLTGPRYGLLRPEFARLRFTMARAPDQRFPVRRLLVFMGLGDPDNLTGRALAAIDSSGIDAEVRVFMGRAAPGVAEAEAWVNKRPNASLHLNAADMPDQLAWADLAIGTAGTSSWERCCLALPTLAVILADNQVFVAEALKNAGATALLGWGKDITAAAMGDALRAFATDRDRIVAMASAAGRVCDGLGAARTAMHLTPLLDRTGDPLTLRPLSPEDADTVFAWQNMPEVRRHFRNPQPPTAAEHSAWMAKRLAATGAVTEIVLRNGVPAGLVRLDPVADGGFEVSILVAPDHQGAGIGTAALKLLRRLVPFGIFKAFVDPMNKASLGAFTAAGYRPDGDWLINGD